MSRSSRSENKDRPKSSEEPLDTHLSASCGKSESPTWRQRLLLRIMTAVLIGWLILLGLLAWWSGS